jgi:LCP family protein required for cell wall assembly
MHSGTQSANSFPAVGLTLNSYGTSEYGTTPPTKPVAKEQSRLKKIFRPKRVVIYLVILILVIGLTLGSSFAYNLYRLFGNSIFGIFNTTTLKGQSTGRINILLAGNSADDPGHDGANLTDSIMIVSIDTKNKTGFLLSVPRDLWVSIPGGGSAKINDAYVVGQNDNFSAPGYPNGGMGLLEEIVSQKFGIPIDYYALINYSAIKDAVNAVGGITININSSDPRGLYDPDIDYATRGHLVKLKNGENTLNGEQALDLARARGDAYGSYGYADSDFTRTQDQREMLIALAQKATSTGVLANPIKLEQLFSSVGSNVSTDLKLNEVKELYSLTKGMNLNQLQSLSLQPMGQPVLVSSYLVDGQDALAPTIGVDNFAQIQEYVQRLISTNPVVKENAPIAVLNSTADNGLASRVGSTLESKGLNITKVGSAIPLLQATEIVDLSNGKYPSTKTYLESQYGNNVVASSTYTALYPNNSFIVILGQDQAVKDPTYTP